MHKTTTAIMSQTHVKPTTFIAIITAAMAVMIMVGYAQTANPNHFSYEPDCDGDCSDNYLKYSEHIQNNYHPCNIINSGLCMRETIQPT